MIKKKQSRRWTAICLAGLMAAGTFIQPLESSASAGESKNGSKDVQVSAEVEREGSAPSYGVIVPASLSIGTLSAESDNIQPYDITVRSEESEGTIVVSTPDSGSLSSEKNSLVFSNEFGTQTVNFSEENVGTTDAGEKEIKLHGQIVITAADVSKAVPGNYTGTATFDITYTKEEEPTLPGGSSLGGSTLPGGSSLGGSSLGGNSSLGGSSDLGGASTIKTGDEERGIVLWILLLAVSAGTVTAGAVRRKYKRNQH